MSVVTLCLLTQWCEIYQILKNPIKAQKNYQTNYFMKLLAILISLNTALLLFDLVAIYTTVNRFQLTLIALLTIFNSGVLVAFIALYASFGVFIGEVQFLRTQIHTFFVVMIVIQCSRLFATTIENCKYLDQETTSTEIVVKLEYFNILTECVFNLFVLFYFAAIRESSQPEIDQRRRMSLDLQDS